MHPELQDPAWIRFHMLLLCFDHLCLMDEQLDFCIQTLDPVLGVHAVFLTAVGGSESLKSVSGCVTGWAGAAVEGALSVVAANGRVAGAGGARELTLVDVGQAGRSPG